MRSSKRFLMLTVPVTLLVAGIACVFFSAQRTLNQSRRAARTAHQVGFSIRAIDPELAAAQAVAFERVHPAAAFTSGVFLESRLYLAGPQGLSIYGADGELVETLRTGLELPVAPIVAMVVGQIRGAPETQVLLATAGAGLLELQPGKEKASLHQLLPSSAGPRNLTTVLPLASGDLLLGTRHDGLFLFDGSMLTAFRFNLQPGEDFDPAALEITSLAAVDSTSFLAGTRGAGLLYVHAGTTQRLDVSSGLPDHQVEALLAAGRRAFAGTPRGVAEIDLSGEMIRTVRTLVPGVFSRALALNARTNELSIGTIDEGVLQVALNASPHLRSASIASPRDLAGTASGQRIDEFLLQTGGSGPLYALADGALVHRSGASWSAALPGGALALADRNISALAFAPDGSLYVGFFDHGIDILSPDAAGPISHVEDDHLFCINRLVLDPMRHTMAAATANGLVFFDAQGTPRQVLTRRDGLISDHISDLAFTKTGVTVATPAGLTFVGTGGTESLYAFQGLVNNHVYALGANGNDDRVLAGTLGGLSMLKAHAVRRNLTVNNSALKHNWITAILPVAAGGYLIGTYGAGVQQMSASGVVTTPDLPAGMPSNLIVNPNALLATQGYIYVGTLDHGMLVYSVASRRWSAVVEGLPSRNVTAFAERNGELYIGTENGLVRVLESKLEAQLQ